ncbi:MAG: SufS family cysteine desulfurase [Gammaproteobacteria bacterium]
MRELAAVRRDFPLLHSTAGGLPFVYLDNAATSQKPAVVIEAVADCYRRHYGPVHRGLYPLAEEASARYERARARLARFVGAPAPEQLIFTRSATEAINLVAAGWAQPRLAPGDEVWVTRMEHHANYLPWQRVCRGSGARLRLIELDADGCLDLDRSGDMLGPRTRLIALTQVSNVLGTINPVREICARARERGIRVLVDAAQAVSHLALDVQDLDCDFLTFSAHKMLGPDGIGALYARAEHLEAMEPLLVGGGMVDRVEEHGSVWAPYPAKFEAGSPNLAGALGFAAAAEYLAAVGMERVHRHLQQLTELALSALRAVPGVQIYGPTGLEQRAGIISFNLSGVHAHDVAHVAGERGVAIRAGHHCCQPLMAHLGVASTARASFALYNRIEDVDALVDAVAAARKMFG